MASVVFGFPFKTGVPSRKKTLALNSIKEENQGGSSKMDLSAWLELRVQLENRYRIWWMPRLFEGTPLCGSKPTQQENR